MKKALINDWYYVNGGAEKVIHSLNQIWDDFDHFALIDFLNENDRTFILNGKKAKTTFIQNLPTVKGIRNNIELIVFNCKRSSYYQKSVAHLLLSFPYALCLGFTRAVFGRCWVERTKKSVCNICSE